MNVRRAAGAAAGALLALSVAGGGVALATDGSSTPGSGSTPPTSVQDQDVNTGPDADPNEPGHQDASDAGDAAEGPETGGEAAEGNSGVEDTDVNSGPDANPNEAGHQDASDAGDAKEAAEPAMR